jgi:DNA polymerase-3 subunit delta'
VTRVVTRGHPAAVAAIGAMIAGSPPHAILIAGPAGVGKTTLALDLAAGLLCDAPDPAVRPCRECRGCRLVERGSHADLHRLAPSGAGNQIRIGDRTDPAPGTVRRLISDLALLPVEGGRRMVIVERADRLNEDAQSALLKTLEEPPPGVTIILCADRDDQLLPTVHSRCVRIRLGPVGIREIEAILADQAVAEAPTGARLARLAGGRPGIARIWALAPEAITARAEIARSLLDLADAGPARRLAAARELLARAGDIGRALDRGREPANATAAGQRVKRTGRPVADMRSSGTTLPGSEGALPAAAVAEQPDDPSEGGEATGPEGVAAADGRDLRAPAAERRRAAIALVEIWADLARDLALVRLGEERRLRDPGLLDELRAAPPMAAGALASFLSRLDRIAGLIDANVAPELAIDVLILAWPRPRAAA